jgi:WD40 repeat protein
MGRSILAAAFITILALVGSAYAQRIDQRPPERVRPPGCPHPSDDLDGDGIPDALEQTLAEKFAPVVYHTDDEPCLPANVDWVLSRTRLHFHDNICKTHLLVFPRQAGGSLTQHDLHWVVEGTCGIPDRFDSYGWADHGNLDPTGFLGLGPALNRSKERTFYLDDVPDGDRAGSKDPKDWKTYFHAYPNGQGGVTIQYWRCYPYNWGSGILGSLFGRHGGDWEGMHVALAPNSKGDYTFREAYLINHDGFVKRDLKWEAGHPVIFVEPGNHGTRETPADARDAPKYARGYRQESWTGGQVTLNGKNPVTGGGLVNVGEKRACLNEQYFIYYSGLWGRPGSTPPSGGYWGPAFNETGQLKDGFVTAWAYGMREVSEEECFPSEVSVEVAGAKEVWRIDRPNVRRSASRYVSIRFRPGDKLVVQSGGCAQSGGSGKTWKRYVNPDPSELYYGTIHIPGVTDGVRPLRDVVDKEFTVGGSKEVGLELGYVDEPDRYVDNGYWGREGDDGTGDQCKGLGDAFVVITIFRNFVQSGATAETATPIQSIAVSPDGRWLASAGTSEKGNFGEIKLWNAADLTEVATLKRYHGLPVFGGFSPDGTLLAVSDPEGRIRVWSTSTLEVVHETTKKELRSVQFSPDRKGNSLLVSYGNSLELWSFRNTSSPIVEKLETYARKTISVAFTPDGTRLVASLTELSTPSVTESPLLTAWDLSKSKPTPVGKIAIKKGLDQLLLSPDGQSLTTACPTGELTCVHLWNIKSSVGGTAQELIPKHELLGHIDQVTVQCFVPRCGKLLLATADTGGVVKFWDTATGRELARSTGPPGKAVLMSYNEERDTLSIYSLAASGKSVSVLSRDLRGLKFYR